MTGWGGSGFGRIKEPLDVIPVGSTQVPGDTRIPDPTHDVYAEITGVATGVQTDIITYVVPASPIQHVLYIEFGGCNVAQYFLEINGSRSAQGVTYFGSMLHGYWDFRNPGGGGKLLPASGIIKVQVKHCRPDDGDFFARICYMDIN